MKRERLVIETFVIDKPKQIKIFEVRIPREVENIIGVELGFNLTEGTIHEDAAAGTGSGLAWEIPLLIKRNICVGELRLQSFSKANLFYAGEIKLDKNIDNGNFASQFFTPKEYTHQTQSSEVKIKLTSKNRMIRVIYRDKLTEGIAGGYKYIVRLYLWVLKKENQKTEAK
jgi:hypothetical protein